MVRVQLPLFLLSCGSPQSPWPGGCLGLTPGSVFSALEPWKMGWLLVASCRGPKWGTTQVPVLLPSLLLVFLLPLLSSHIPMDAFNPSWMFGSQHKVFDSGLPGSCQLTSVSLP